MKTNFKQTVEFPYDEKLVKTSTVTYPELAVYRFQGKLGVSKRVPASLEFNYKYITRNKKLEIVEAISWEIDQEIWEYEFPEKKIYTNTTK